MKGVLLFIIITVVCTSLPAQRVKLEYGGSIGMRMTQLIPDYEVKYNDFDAYKRNIQSDKKDKFDWGYNTGIFLRTSFHENKFYFQTDVSLSRIGGINSNKISFDWYSSDYPPGGKSGIFWEYISVIKTLNVPVIAGLQTHFNEKISYGLFGGMSAHIIMHEKTGGIVFAGSDENHKVFLSYLGGIQLCYTRFFLNFKYEKSLAVRNPEWDLSHYKKINKVFINVIEISTGIKFNLPGV